MKYTVLRKIAVMADQKFDSASFNAGRDAAIQEVSDFVAGYIALQKSGDNPDPWEVWLPHFLELLKGEQAGQ